MTKKDRVILNQNLYSSIPQHVYSIISEVYNSKDRFYHTNEHISKMLSNLEMLVEKYDINKSKSIFVLMLGMAIIFHDVVLFEEDPVLKSAEVAELLLKNVLTEDEMKCVIRLIKATDWAYIPQSEDELIIRDLDLLILSSDWDEYSKYAKNIELEFGRGIPREQYIDGRKRVLENMLKWDKIYDTEYFEHLNEKAKVNIKRELTELLKSHSVDK